MSLQVHNSFLKNYGREMSTFRCIIPLLHHVTILGQSMWEWEESCMISSFARALFDRYDFQMIKVLFFQELVAGILKNGMIVEK